MFFKYMCGTCSSTIYFAAMNAEMNIITFPTPMFKKYVTLFS